MFLFSTLYITHIQTPGNLKSCLLILSFTDSPFGAVSTVVSAEQEHGGSAVLQSLAVLHLALRN